MATGLGLGGHLKTGEAPLSEQVSTNPEGYRTQNKESEVDHVVQDGLSGACGPGGCGNCPSDCSIEVDLSLEDAIAKGDIGLFFEAAEQSYADAISAQESLTHGEVTLTELDPSGNKVTELTVKNEEVLAGIHPGSSLVDGLRGMLNSSVNNATERGFSSGTLNSVNASTSLETTGRATISQGGQNSLQIVPTIGRVVPAGGTEKSNANVDRAAATGFRSEAVSGVQSGGATRVGRDTTFVERNLKQDATRTDLSRQSSQSYAAPVRSSPIHIVDVGRMEMRTQSSSLPSSSLDRKPSPELRQIVASLIAVEKSLQEARPVSVVLQALQKLSQDSRSASSVNPSLVALAQRVSLLTNVFGTAQPTTALSVRVVRQQMQVVRDMLVKVLPSTSMKAVGQHPTRSQGAGIQQITPNKVINRPSASTETLASKRAIVAAVRDARHLKSHSSPREGVISKDANRPPGLLSSRQGAFQDSKISKQSQGMAQRLSGSVELNRVRSRRLVDRNLNKTEKLSKDKSSLSARMRGRERNSAQKIDNFKRNVKLRSQRKDAFNPRKETKLEIARRKQLAQKIERLLQRGKLTKEMKRELRNARNLERALRGTKRLKDAVARLRAKRVAVQKRLVERQGRERSTLRKRPLSSRGQEAIQQQELAKKLNKAVKKLLREGDEELLGLLSPMERRLMKNLAKKLDAAATINDLKKNLKKAKKQKGGSKSSGAEASVETASSKSSSGSRASLTKGGSAQPKSAPEGAQPSKSLDLVTDKIGDGNNKNGYEAGAEYSSF